MTNNSILVLLFLLVASVVNAQYLKLEESVYFDSDKFELKDSEKSKLSSLLDSVSNNSIVSVHIVGNTDNSADSLYNIALSKNRCNSVHEFCMLQNAEIEVFKFDYFGANKPFADNVNEEGRQKNRRVDISILYRVGEIEEIDIHLDAVLQEADTCTGIDTTLTLENGTELIFNRCEYNEFRDCLQIVAIRTTDELIENGTQLRTVEGIPLITCGMISLSVDPECNIQKSCFDYPVKVRFPYPSDKDCLPCEKRDAEVFNVNGGGAWVAAGISQEKVEVVKVGKSKYYQLEIACPDGRAKNCDCKGCVNPPKGKRKANCSKVKLKLPKRYQLISAEIFVDCPPTVVYFSPDTTKLFGRRNIAKTETLCHTGDHRIQVLALDAKGDTVRIGVRPLGAIKHRVLFSHCKKGEVDNQKTLGIFATKKRGFYRKYVLKKADFDDFAG